MGLIARIFSDLQIKTEFGWRVISIEINFLTKMYLSVSVCLTPNI